MSRISPGNSGETQRTYLSGTIRHAAHGTIVFNNSCQTTCSGPLIADRVNFVVLITSASHVPNEHLARLSIGLCRGMRVTRPRTCDRRN